MLAEDNGEGADQQGLHWDIENACLTLDGKPILFNFRDVSDRSLLSPLFQKGVLRKARHIFCFLGSVLFVGDCFLARVGPTLEREDDTRRVGLPECVSVAGGRDHQRGTERHTRVLDAPAPNQNRDRPPHQH